MKLFRISICFICLFFCASALSASNTNNEEALKNVCKTYAENWVSLTLHYKGSSDFYKLCTKASNGKDLLSGMWAIRPLIPDGHAGFRIKQAEQSKMFPFVLEYNPYLKDITLAVGLNETLSAYSGQRVVSINGKDPLDFIKKRAKLEPQSTQNSSLEIAARNAYFQPAWMPYPDFPDSVTIVLKDGHSASFSPVLLKDLIKKYPNLITRNLYPSILASLKVDNKYSCITNTESAKIITYNGNNWLQWHPASMSFDMDKPGKAFKCWNKYFKNNIISGVILDLRDTAGGGYEQVMTVASLFGIPEKMTFTYKTAGGETDSFTVTAPKLKYQHWFDQTIVLTNGLCGSGCEVLAWMIAARKNVCTYGTPTAGRRNGTSDIKINNSLTIDVPMRDYLNFNGKRMEGVPLVPMYHGSMDPVQIINSCGM